MAFCVTFIGDALLRGATGRGAVDPKVRRAKRFHFVQGISNFATLISAIW